ENCTRNHAFRLMRLLSRGGTGIEADKSPPCNGERGQKGSHLSGCSSCTQMLKQFGERMLTKEKNQQQRNAKRTNDLCVNAQCNYRFKDAHMGEIKEHAK